MASFIPLIRPGRARLYSVALALFCYLGLTVNTSIAQTTVITAETQANATTTGSQRHVSVAMDGSNNFAIAWDDTETDGGGVGIYCQVWDNTATISVAQFQVTGTTATNQSHPDIAMDNTGDFAVVWMSEGQDGDGWGVYGRIFNSSGVAQTGEFLVNTTTTGDQRFPKIAMENNGDFVVIWESDQTIMGQRYTASGTTSGTEFTVNTDVVTDKMSPDVAMDNSGDFVVVWQSIGQDTDGYGIYLQRYNGSGTAQGSETAVNTTTVGHQIEPSVSMDGSGNFVVTWASYAQDTDDYGIYGQMYTSAGATTGSEFLVNTTVANVQHSPNVAMSENGIFTVTWTDSNKDTSFSGIYMQVYNAAGTAKGSETVVNTTTDDFQQFSSTVINGDEGHMLIAWQDGLRNSTATTDADEYGIRFKEYSIADITDPVAVCQDITVQLDGTGNITVAAASVDNGSSDANGVTLSLDVTAFDCTDIGANTVTLTAEDPAGNTDTCTATVTIEDGTDPTVVTQNITVALDGTGNVTIATTDIDNGSSDNCETNLALDITAFDCTDLGANTVTLTVTDGVGNSADGTATVTVEDNENPTVVAQDITVALDGTGNATITPAQVDNGSADNCAANLSLDVTAFDCTDLGANTVTLTVSDDDGNSVNTTATVTIEDNENPSVVAQDITVALDGTGNVTITPAQVDNGSSDNCAANLSLDITAFDCTDLGANTVTLTVSDDDGNSVNTTATVTVEDNENPTVVAQDITVSLDGTGNVTITPAQVDNGSADNCAANLSLDVTAFDCTDIGANTVTLTVSDDDGNSVNTTATVTIEDNEDPTVVTQDITVQLDGTGNVSITTGDVDNGSSDNCETNFGLDITAFDCTDLGANTVTLTVTDGVGNSANATATVTVEDNTNPTAVSQDITVSLDGTGNVSITPAQIDNGSSDNCAANLSLDITAFDCTDLGANTVTLTVSDDDGNSADATATVTVEDNENPTVVAQDITVSLDGTGNATITPAQVDNGSADNCAANLSLDITAFDCTDIGANTVTLTVSDDDGNSVNTTATVTIEDNEDPTVVTQNITVQLDGTGNVSITTGNIDNGSSDNCETNFGLDITAFDCTDLGANTVTLTVTDGVGNSANATATVTVEDNTNPTAVSQDITVSLDGTGNVSITPAQIDNGSSDNCAANLSLDITAFDCTDLGANTVTLTVSDDDGNSVDATATVTVEDNENPTAVAQDITVSLDGTGNATITPAQIDNGSADNCAANLSLDVTAFDCTDIGANTVTLTVSDDDGNSVNTTATVTIEDNEDPTVVTQDITVQLDGTGNVSITTGDIDNGSADNCETNFGLDITAFDCTDLGANTVTLTVTDGVGNSANATATVTVEDNTNPTAISQDITVSLDGTGNVSITPAQIDNGSSDNCAANLSLDITAFDCTDLGTNTVTLTVSDDDGNSVNTTATVTVEDNENPTVVAQDITVSLDGTGNATITPAQIDNGSADNCAANLSLDVTAFDCTDIGANTVTLTVSDDDGNSVNTTATVTIEDNENPTTLTQDITVQLDGTGNVSITTGDIDNGSTDNCETNLSLDVTAFDCTDLGANTVTLTVTDGVGNSTDATATVTVEDNENPVVVGQDITVSLDGTGNVSITPAQIDNGSSDNCTANLSLDVTAFDCTDLGANTVTLTVSDDDGNSVNTTATVTVEDNENPTVVAQDITVSLDGTGNATITPAQVDNGSADNCAANLSLDVTTFDCTDIGANTVTLTVSDDDGNSVNTTATVTIEDNENPTALTQDITVQLDGTGNVSITTGDIDNGSTDNCETNLSLDVTAFDCTDIGANTVTLTVTDGVGNSTDATATVTVEDNENPVVVGQDITVSLDGTGNVSITPAQIDNGSSDNCTANLSLDVTAFDCTDLGANTVTLTVSDDDGNSVNTTATVTVEDNENPTVVAQDITVSLDGTGNATITPAQVDNGSADNCTANLSLDVTTFDCTDIGANTVTLTVSDDDGNSVNTTATVTIEDNENPTALAQDVTVQLDGTGNASITTGDIDNGSSDNCETNLSLDITAFDCTDLGANTVTLTVTDGVGNSTQATATVTVEDNIDPVVSTQDITVSLDGTGNVSITPSDVDNGSSDNCNTNLSLDVSSFDCTDVGMNVVTLTVTDDAGNSVQDIAFVTVEDNEVPVAIAQDITVSLDGTGNVSITTGDVDNGSSDNCATNLSLDVTAFDCTDIGANTVTLTVTDDEGNSDNATATVTVEDNENPTVLTQDITVQLDGTGNVSITTGDIDNGSSDNCETNLSLDVTAFDCTDIGANTVTLTVTDGVGNSTNGTATVTVEDNVNPSIVAQNITVSLDGTGNVSISASDVDNGSTDNCAANLSLDVTTFDCTDIGSNTVTLTVSDNDGNSVNTTATVTVEDNENPTAVAQDITVSLDGTGNATITTGDIDNGSSDNCETNLSLDVTTFDCFDLGTNTVTLTVTDGVGNSSNATATVTVEDNESPTALAQDVTVQLDGTGNASITTGDIDNGSSDNCEANLTLDITAFDCTDLGANTVTLTATDAEGNSTQATATVTVEDSIDPVVSTQDITVSLDGTGNVSITPSDVDNGSSDNCNTNLSLDVSSFDCTDVGMNVVTLTVTDDAGNSVQDIAFVTVEDNEVPVAIAQDITVSLDGTGNVSITTGDVDNGSSDNCATNLSLDVTAFDCTDIGANTVTLTVTDDEGNSDNATATVTVEDNENPTVLTQDITVQLDGTGNVSITTGDIDNGSSDNCETNLSLDVTAFDCTDIGANTVTLTVTDGVGNSTNGTATVTVEDNVNPSIVAQNITVSLDGTGNVSISASDVDNGSTDNCTANLSLDVTTFDCTDIGPNTVTLTVSDNDGNSVNTTATVTVEDNENPTAVAQDITVSLDGTGNATITTGDIDNGSSDNCETNLSLDVTSFDCTDIGTNTVTLTVTDGVGNSSNATATVTVEDNESPTALAQDVTVQLDGTGNASITTGDIDNGSSDNCEANLTLDITAFDCTDLGANTVTLTATDAEGNSTQATATVTVEDSIDPVVSTQDITVSLDATGNITVDPSQVDNGSSDNCNTNLSLDVSSFDCTDVGMNVVTLTVTDDAGNSVQDIAFVTVEDNEVPIAIAQDITVSLDGTGNVTITTGDIDNGSSDNCATNLSLDVTAFDCTDIGANTVTLTVTDDEGNSDNATATVTVEDNENPTVLTQDITVQLDGTGNVSITTGDIDNGSSDNCETNLSLDVTAFDCTDIGANTVTLIVTDGVGNSTNGTATVTVEDNENPSIVAQNISVSLDGTGNVSITASDVDNGSTDNCTANLSLDVTTFDCTDIGPNTVTLTVSDNDGNSVNTTATVTVEDNEDPTAIAQDITVSLDGTGNATITTGDIDNGSSDNCETNLSLDITAFDCTDIGTNTVTLTVTDGVGNSSNATATVTVEDNESPTALAQDITVQLDGTGNVSITTGDIDNGSTDNCETNLSLDVATFDCTDLGANIVTLTVTDGVGNSTQVTATVTVEDNIDPVVSTQDITVSLDATGNITIDPSQVDNGSSDNCNTNLSLDVSSFDCTDVGMNVVTLTVTDDAGNSVQDVAFVTVEDNENPTVLTQDITVQLDGTGNVSITTGDVDNGSSDNCNFTLSLDVTDFDCTDVGANSVTLTATDDEGNTANATATVTVEDDEFPNAIAQDITIQLDGTGNASITTGDINNGSTDNCETNLSLDVTSFDCTNIGANVVTLTVTDGVGNASQATATVTVEDTEDPTIVVQDITVQLDATGNVIIDPSQVDNGSTDNCTTNLSLDITAFDCTNVGDNTVMLTVSDNDGNSVTASATVTVEDNEAPTAVAQDITVQLDATGNASITATDIDNGSTDNCAANISIDVTAFDCTDLGDHTVTLTVMDNSGNSSQTTATVTVEDVEDPTVITQDVTIQLDATGSASITTADVDNGSSDNCGVTLSLDITDFDCTNVGSNTVTLTGVDDAGNSVQATATVTVEDTEDPTVVAQNITVQLDATGNVTVDPSEVDNGSTDNCSSNLSLDITSFDCTDIGDNTVTLTNTDDDGNTVSTTATITVEDNEAPTAITQDITVQLDAAGNASITAADIDNGSTDNCSVNLSIDITDFDCTSAGANTVTLTVMDAVGNSSQSTATVTVEDADDPTVIAQDVTVQLDANGAASISTADIDNGSSDNCGVTLSLDVTEFDCSNIGVNIVTLTGTDAAGNSVQVAANVTVEDNEVPVASAQDITIQLDGTGNATISTADIDNGSSDNCSFALSLDIDSFDCTNLGDNAVTLTVTDGAGNTDNATATVTVEDTELPIAVAKDISVELDESGTASITTTDIDDGSSDNCGITLTLDKTTFECTDIGDQTVTLTVTDDAGNSVQATATVTVEDNFIPTVIAQDITVQLDENGTANITTSEIDNGSSDNCELTLSLDRTSFTCDDIGSNTVILTATDAAGNSSDASVTITVEDVADPVVLGKDISIELDGTGNASISTSDIDDGSTDNCLFNLSLDITEFDCTNIGDNTVTMSATDISGNISSTTVTVTVQDNEAPIALAKDITISLDDTGNASITTEMIDDGSSDNCNFGLSLSQTDFDCTHIGENSVTLIVTDDAGNTSTTGFTVTVEDSAPIAISKDITISLDENGTASITASDIDNGSSDDCTGFELSLDISSFGCENLGDNAVVLTVTDNTGKTDQATATVTIVDDSAPVLSVRDVSLELDEFGSVILTTEDVDVATSDNCNFDITLSASDFTCDDLGTNSVTVTATDESGNSDEAEITVTIQDNINPTAIAQDIGLQLDDNGEATITPADVDGGSTDNCSFTLTVDRTSFTSADIGDVQVTLTITDDAGNTDTDVAVVTVEPNEPPAFTSSPVTEATEDESYIYQIEAEDTNFGDVLTITATTIPDWLTLTDNGDGTAALEGIPGDANIGDHDVVLVVSDNVGETDTQSFTVTVENINDLPIFASDPVLSVNEDSDYLYEIVVTDDDVADMVSISSVQIPEWMTLTDNGGGNAELTGSPTNDEVGIYDIELLASDENNGETTQVFTVTVINVNDAPMTQDATFEINENSPFGTIVGTVEASDVDVDDVLDFSIIGGNIDDAFDVSSAGNITVANAAAIDFETTPTFNLTVRVADLAGAEVFAAITVNLLDVDDDVNSAPEISDQTFNIDENSPFGTLVGNVTASDPDDDALAFTIVSGNVNSAFEIDNNGDLTVKTTEALDFETRPQFILRVEVNDGKGGIASATMTVDINDIDDTTNQDPTIADQEFTIEENSALGSFVGQVIATDPDSDQLIYSLPVGNVDDAFAISTEVGLITVNNPDALDFETTPVFNLIVEVSDGQGGVARGNVVVNLTDIIDEPVTNIDEELQRNIDIFPNPSEHYITLNSIDFESGDASIKLFDLAGTEIPIVFDRISGEDYNADITDLAPGVYMISIEINGKGAIKKLIKY